MHCAQRDDCFKEYINDECSLTTSTLGSVCSLWRNISLNTPYLWSRFSLEMGSGWNLDSIKYQLELYLSRSQQFPLSFDVWCEDEFMGEHQQLICQSIVRLLIEQSHRWSHTSWNIWSAETETRALLNVSRDLPLLRTLTLQGPVDDDHPFGIFKSALSLSRLTLSSPNLETLDICMDHLNHLRITDLADGNGVMNSIQRLANCFPKLRTLSLELQDVPVNVLQSHIREVYLGMLESLHLQYATWYEIISVFSVLSLPSLRKISLVRCNHDLDSVSEDQTHPYERTTSVIASFLSRSNCPLSILELTELPGLASLGIVDRMLFSIPSLIELKIHEALSIHDGESHFTTSFSQALRIPKGSSPDDEHRESSSLDASQSQCSKPILPNLRSLDLLVNTDRPGFDPFALANMIESRCIPDAYADNVQCLRAVKVAVVVHSRESQTCLGFMQHLNHLKDAGMPIELQNSSVT
ncbi:hypothetical protein VKT23_010554 [Stygiomarasmius scandens]|uniref:F-box domain-containing protein n=1 Tax=Marasmiellus scandens TaxID=2682957 RepID=A0ABR1JEH9_9AGAR